MVEAAGAWRFRRLLTWHLSETVRGRDGVNEGLKSLERFCWAQHGHWSGAKSPPTHTHPTSPTL